MAGSERRAASWDIELRGFWKLCVFWGACAGAIPSSAHAYDQSDLEQLLNSEPPNCAGCDLVGADLENGILGAARIPGADLSSAHLVHAYLKNANLNGAVLKGANLTGANLTGADLTGAALEEARLCKTIMPNGDVNDRDCAPPKGSESTGPGDAKKS